MDECCMDRYFRRSGILVMYSCIISIIYIIEIKLIVLFVDSLFCLIRIINDLFYQR